MWLPVLLNVGFVCSSGGVCGEARVYAIWFPMPCWITYSTTNFIRMMIHSILTHMLLCAGTGIVGNSASPAYSIPEQYALGNLASPYEVLRILLY